MAKRNGLKSPSARKVWIEIETFVEPATGNRSPSARKVWIEIATVFKFSDTPPRHLPQGRCGLKLRNTNPKVYDYVSPSARKVWIEIFSIEYDSDPVIGHLPQGRCGLK